MSAIKRNPLGESWRARARRIWREETSALHLRLVLVNLIISLLPYQVGSRLRTWLYRAAGLNIGRTTVILGKIEFTGNGDIHPRLKIGENGVINWPCYLNLGAAITIGDRVAIGHHAVLITDEHEIGASFWRAGALQSRPIVIEDGCWLGARVTVLPGVTIGRGAVVAAGAVVARDAPPNTLVGGVPAKIIKELPVGEV